MSNSQLEKIKLEHQAAKLFMRLYEKRTGVKIRHIWHNQPRKPDVSCRINDQRLDLEIAHVYASEKEAMAILGRELTDEMRQVLIQLEAQANLNQRLIDALQRILYIKSGKFYKTSKVWLVIRNAHPDWTKAIIKEHLAQIIVPKTHPFEQIWLVSDFDGSELIQLFPEIRVLSKSQDQG